MGMQIFRHQRHKGSCANKGLLERHRKRLSKDLDDILLQKVQKEGWSRGTELPWHKPSIPHSARGLRTPQDHSVITLPKLAKCVERILDGFSSQEWLLGRTGRACKLTEMRRQAMSTLYSAHIAALGCEEKGEGGKLSLKWPNTFWPADHACKAAQSVWRV